MNGCLVCTGYVLSRVQIDRTRLIDQLFFFSSITAVPMLLFGVADAEFHEALVAVF